MILIISRERSLLYRDQPIDFHGRLIDWFPVGGALCHEAVFVSYHIYHFVIVTNYFVLIHVGPMFLFDTC